MAGRKIEVQIVGDASKLERSFKNAASSSKSFGSSLAGLGRTAGLATAALGVAAAGGLAFALKKGIEEFSEMSKVAAQTGAVLKSTAGAANVTAADVDKLAESLMRKSGIDDEAIKSGENMLLTFTRIRNEAGRGNDIFNQATKATLDLSVAMGKDMADSAVLVGKALNDPLKGMTALGRAGIQFTEAQKKSIAAMVESGNVMGAQKTILAELNTQFGGSAEALGKTLPGQINVLKQSMSNLAGEVVASIVPAFQGAVTAVTGFVTKLSEAKGTRAKIEVVLEGGQELVAKALKIGQDIGAQIMEAVGNVDWTATGNKVAAALGVAFKKGIPAMAEFAKTITEGFQRAIQDADWVTIGASIGQGIKDGVKKAARKKIEDGMSDTLKSASSQAQVAAFGMALDVAEALGNKLGIGVKTEVPKAMAPTSALIKAGIDPAIATAIAGGGRIGSGLAGGLTAALSGVGASVAATIISQITSTELQLKQKYGIHSPSTVWRDRIGKPLAEGIVEGLDGGLQLLFPKAQARLKAYTDKLEAQMNAARTRLGNAMSSLSDKLLRAFDAETSGTMTPAEAEIAAINARRRLDDLNRALQEAQATGNAEAIARAQEDLHLHSLEAQAANERKAWDDQRAAMRERLEGRLTQLAEHFKKEGVTVQMGLAAITKLMTKFGITFEEAGAYIGKSFLFGLQQAVGGAAAAAGGVRGAQTGGNARPLPPIVTQVILDERVVAESVRKQNVIYQRANGGVFV